MKHELNFKENYVDFNEFYEKNKKIIFDETLKLFYNFKTSNIESVSLIITATIHNFDWSTELKYLKSNYKVLKNEILNYYESIDDYETCQSIMNLYNELTN